MGLEPRGQGGGVGATLGRGGDGEIGPVFGEVYTIRDIRCFAFGVGLLFCELKNPPLYGIEGHFCQSVFRPVVERKTDISIFKKMLTPSDAEVADHRSD